MATRTNGEIVDVGDMKVKPGYTLSGRIVLSDGKAVAPDMRVSLATDTGGDRVAVPGPDGQFEFKGVAGPYLVYPNVRGYRLPQGLAVETLVDRNVTDLVITLNPAPVPDSSRPATR